MKKSNLYAKNGALIFGVGNGFLNIVKQLEEMNKDTNLKFNWPELLSSLSKGALIGGTAGFGVGWILDFQNSKQSPMDIDKHLHDRSGMLTLDKKDPEFVRLRGSVKSIKEEFVKHFGKKISGELIPHGSTEKGTALNSSYDIDIAVPFKPKSFPSNEIMYLEVFSFFEERIGKLNIIDVREQKRSIGVCVELKTNSYWVDFAPYKLSKDTKTSGYLFVNKKGFLFDNSTIQKTDLSKLKMNKFTDAQQRIIVLLKDWKLRQDLPLPSHFLEYLVLDSYQSNKGNIPKRLNHKMIMILRHIADKLHVIYIQGMENTNNIISNSIDSYDKQIIVEACNRAIKEYEYQPNSITKNFN
jgi:hypothetical protein